MIYPAAVAVQVQLVHSESDREIFRLPLLHVGIAILHAYPLHDRAAARIVYVVGGGNVGKALFFQKRYERGGSLACNSPMPIFPAERVTEITAVAFVRVYVADGETVFFQADCKAVSAVQARPVKLFRLLHIVKRIPRQKGIHLFIGKKQIYRLYVARFESSQYKSFRNYFNVFHIKGKAAPLRNGF